MIKTVLYNLPPRISGFTVKSGGDYTIFLNARHSWESQKKTYYHEIEHIESGDFESDLSADELETLRNIL